MKIRYIQLRANLNLPGQPAQLKKISNTGTDASQNGCAKSITPTPGGYIVHLPAGSHAGFYFVPLEMVDHARVDLDAAELDAIYPPPPVVEPEPKGNSAALASIIDKPKTRAAKKAAPKEQTPPVTDAA